MSGALSFNQCRPAEAIGKYTGDVYIQRITDAPAFPFRLTLILSSLTLEIIVDTPTETPPKSTFDIDPDAPVAETPPPSPHGLSGMQTPAAFVASTAAGGEREPEWGLATALGVWFTSLGLLVVGSVLALLVYLVVRPSPISAGGMQCALESDPLFLLLAVAATLPMHLLTFACAWAVLTGFGKRPFRAVVGWEWGERFGFWTCFGLATGLWIGGLLLANLFHGGETEIERLIASSSAARFSIAFLAVATAPIVEETIYRGVLYPPLARAAGTRWAIAIVSLMFTGVHVMQYWNNVGVIAAVAVLSFTLTWVRARTGRLLPCFAIHAFFNGIQAVIIIAQPYLKTLIPTQPEAPPGMLLDAVARVLSVVQI